uniref:Uncharacterized protein n=1 Tax=Glossina morsitans morsitans TaxID=37546 RepID=A0A1B0G628_GLOMM
MYIYIYIYPFIKNGMKYPQLVSTRAVNAISDWLVSRLEQLGVESPQIYTRLLLSLLQSSVQVNDPIEFSNLEVKSKFMF